MDGLQLLLMLFIIIIVLGIIYGYLKNTRTHDYPPSETKNKFLKYIYSITFSISVTLLIYFIIDTTFIKSFWQKIFHNSELKTHLKYINTLTSAVFLLYALVVSSLIHGIIEYSIEAEIKATSWDNIIGFIIGKSFILLILSILILWKIID